MKRSFAASRQSFFLLFIFLLIAISSGFYYYNYVEEKKDTLIQRNFRQLYAVSTKIQQRIIGLSLAIKSNAQGEDSIRIQNNLKNLITDNDTILVTKEKKKEKINFETDSEKLLLQLIKTEGGFSVDIKIKGIDAILNKMKKQGLFDDFFIATHNGDTVVQPPSRTLTITKLDSLKSLDGRPLSFNVLSDLDAVGKFTSGNKDYIIFIHPMRLHNQTNSDQQKWVICGIIGAGKFKTESLAISSNTILLFLVIFLMIILVWPLLKLRFVSRYGRIRSYDITMAAVSITLAAAVLTFTIIDFAVYENLNAEVDTHLKNMSYEIQKNFLEEICLVHSELDRVTQFKKSKGEAEIYNFFSRKEDYKDQDTSLPKHSAKYKYFDLMHWSDEKGDQQFKFLMKNKKTPFINLKSREYFQSVINKKLWTHICTNPAEKNAKQTLHDTTGIFLQPLVSLTTGDFSVSLSKEEILGSAIVGAVDFLPVSVYSTILPPGFSFCIIDKKGEVLFHSNNDRNLTEVFLDEIENPEFLNAAIISRSKELFTSNYWGKTYRMIINPVNGLPWNIIVMFEKDLLRRNNLETASVSFFLFFLYVSPFIILLLFFLLIKGSSRNWIWPIGAYEPIYKKLLVYFILSSAVLSSFYLFSTDQTIIFFTAWLFPHSSLVLTGLIIILKMQNSIHNPKRIWQIAILVSMLDAVLVYIIVISLFKVSISIILFPLIIWVLTTFTGLVILLEFPIKTEEKLNKRAKYFMSFIKDFLKDKKSMKHTVNWYAAAVTAFLILGSVLPSVGFFIITCESQVRSYIKQAQLNYFERIEEKKEQINNYYSKEMFQDPGGLITNRFNDPADIYFSSFYNSVRERDEFYKDVKPAVTWFDTSIVHSIIPNIGKAGVFPKVLTYNSADEYFTWYTYNSDSVYNLILKPSNYAANDSLIFVSNLPRLSKIFSEAGVGFWIFFPLIIIGSIFLFYFVIHYVMTNIFLVNADNLLYRKNYRLLNNNLKQNILILSNNPSALEKVNKDVTAAAINIPDIIKQEFDQEIKKTLWIINPEDVPDVSGSIVIVNNFEYGFSNADINRAKLIFLEDLIHTRKNKVILISSVHPLGGFTCTEQDTEREIKQNIINRWKEILSGFISTSIYKDEETEDILFEEQPVKPQLSFSEFIRNLFKSSSTPVQFINRELKNKEVRIFHPEVEEIAGELTEITYGQDLNYYHLLDLAMDRTRTYNQFLWDSCSIDEKLVLVRLAQDRLVPVSNISTVENLLRRGLLKREPNLKPYNILFTHFILEVNHPEEVYWDEQVSQSGWNKFRIPILIVLTAIIVFLFYTQSDLYSNTLAIITAASALIPAVLRFFGMFQARQLITKENN